MLLLTGRVSTRDEALALLTAKLESGEAFEKFKTMVTLQGGDAGALDEPHRLPQAVLVEPLAADANGFITGVDADRIGRAVILLGGGRAQVTDTIDPAVGIARLCKIGDKVTAGQPLLELHANDRDRLDAATQMARQAITVAPQAITPLALVVETIRPKDL